MKKHSSQREISTTCWSQNASSLFDGRTIAQLVCFLTSTRFILCHPRSATADNQEAKWVFQCLNWLQGIINSWVELSFLIPCQIHYTTCASKWRNGIGQSWRGSLRHLCPTYFSYTVQQLKGVLFLLLVSTSCLSQYHEIYSHQPPKDCFQSKRASWTRFTTFTGSEPWPNAGDVKPQTVQNVDRGAQARQSSISVKRVISRDTWSATTLTCMLHNCYR